MAIRPDWTTGTLTLVSGSVNFTTTGSALQTAAVQAGDEIITASGHVLIIEKITGQNSGTLYAKCPAGAAGAGQALRIRYQPDGSRYQGAVRDLVSLLSGGQLQSLAGLDLVVGDYLRAVGAGVIGKVAGKNLDALAALAGVNNGIPMFTGDNAMSLLDANNLPLGKIASAYNWIINGNFNINQRGATSKAQPVGVYGYDRWKGHANGLEQIIEALPAGEYTLTWSGGGTGTFGATTKASPIKATVGAGNRSIIVPANATKVSLVIGDSTGADPWVNVERPRSIEDTLCWRYFFRVNGWIGGHPVKYGDAGGIRNAGQVILPNMRVAPTARILSQPNYLNCSDLSFGSAQRSDYAYAIVNVTALGSYRAWGGSFDFDAEFA